MAGSVKRDQPNSKWYPTISRNQWVQPIKTGYRMACCDCGLIHVADFRVVKGKVQLRMRRDSRATWGFRKRRKIRLVTNFVDGKD